MTTDSTDIGTWNFENGGAAMVTVHAPAETEPRAWITFQDAGVEVAIAEAADSQTSVFVRKLRSDTR
jgi:hypothetical protein